ncbi:MAG: NAD(P)/FAD-dependent oxidoreductase [Gammaproteobacteria bacterium]|nr:NAD(P)/FAD-dependent oxidoreductase [Gammaproteobacteria bacterium]
MSRSKSFIRLQELQAIAHLCLINKVPVDEGIEIFQFDKSPTIAQSLESARGAVTSLASKALTNLKRKKHPHSHAPSIGIVGAGIAGLSCGYELAKRGIRASLYEGSERVGGRCYSQTNFFGHNIELGGELIDSRHDHMLAYAREFGLTLEDITKIPGEHAYYFFGQHYRDQDIIEDYNALVAAMQDDLQMLSAQPTAQQHTEHDARLDKINLSDYLDSKGASPLLKAVFRTACEGEYGVPLEQQSCLSFLLFMNSDRNTYWRPWGLFSDERYHVVEGNQQIPLRMAAQLETQIHYQMALEHIGRTANGQVQLSFANGQVIKHDLVVLAIPFSVLKNIALDDSLQFPAWKNHAIASLQSGTNAKTMYAFQRPYWRELGYDGLAEADLPNHQTTWETNPTLATSQHAILTDFSSGKRGASLLPDAVQKNAAAFLRDLNLVYPGIQGLEIRTDDAQIAAVLQAWPHNEFAKGSYSCNAPGYFTGIAGLEALPVGNVLFAGEHTDSVYDWQGTMEGALRSGIRAAQQIRDWRL